MLIKNAELTWLESGLPFSRQFNDVYHSQEGALAESNHVFLNGNSLEQRWLRQGSKTSKFIIAELGFGTGLNFLLTWQLWNNVSPRPSHLHYLAFEKHPIDHQSLTKMLSRWSSLSALSGCLLKLYPDHSAGLHRLVLDKTLTLDLYYGDACTQLSGRHVTDTTKVDAWFLDGFSPKLNPQMWRPELIRQIALNSKPGTSLSSYSVAGSVRSALGECGFEITKNRGFGSKRHMLIASFSGNPTAQPELHLADYQRPPWFHLPLYNIEAKRAIVIGAGLAGCSTAYSLACRGWHVQIIERHDEPASGSSGNKQSALQCRLQKTESPDHSFYLHAYLFAARHYGQLSLEHDFSWKSCGVLQLPQATNKKTALQFSHLEKNYPAQILQEIDAQSATAITGVNLEQGGWWLPQGGWLDPGLLCRAYLAHPGIELRLSTPIEQLERSSNYWEVHSEEGGVFTAEVVVIANNYCAGEFAQSAGLPLVPVRGQASHVPSTARSKSIKTVICGERTIFPAYNQSHMLAASYIANDENTEIRAAENSSNLLGVEHLFTDPEQIGSSISHARASTRASSIDHRPIVGMVPDVKQMHVDYAQLARNAKSSVTSSGAYLPDLYISTAHGSCGLASCPISGEYLASLINQDSVPLNQELMDHIGPARFIIRDLKKQRTA
ncbi:MAG: bifunctional tRNA (5-methylaminomethyl-2-thiouridine)(34)-methyltransferase MnmD/FAD-dependent 5-carboxymethylaminomethyl-2-thiouridine(34) oxidoreductase MnmC [Gammaproteobacteria bacterium]|jgi:tRNA 5-methylaminomethyl-2-thiouridine biosynthesis bifunctional protein|nr:bifunctional tRNA (5-methylaminomethyl-2-thiouridine)(34)-methyltransferase MnmD/FAD-dependent 5-carboxymethylaminomethyl-2-thiouridine(34) oxidoreductase MnmC [Gammaproteobacteria bacterium]MDP6095179.1 bifunctional tRNA (5-methylaminomethyl-2-thiouridine)(34)-methyltransferase MnmD/FAD-dependent 5-carboxymethylaminomethyl-2-thiouridine(34) oxidoreductase MnmC [Gammaproteobacteria bacterium]